MPGDLVECVVEIEEVSSGVYKITATDKAARQFSKSGQDLAVLKEEAYRYFRDQRQSGPMKGNSLSKGAIVCEHVARRSALVRKAVRSEPVAVEDSGWQFLCGQPELEREENAAIWSVQEVIDYESSLAPWVDSDIGTVIERSNNSTTWRKNS